jgi:hypothetical protein
LSIIYDALKKAEKNINTDMTPETNKASGYTKSKLYLIYVLAACFGLFIGNIVFAFLSRTKAFARKPDTNVIKEPTNKMPVPPITSTKPADSSVSGPQAGVSRYSTKGPAEPWVLNGIFFSGNQGYALINNQIVKVGDCIGAATVKRITIKEVELDIGGSSVRLMTNQR